MPTLQGAVPNDWPMRAHSDFVRASTLTWHVQSVGDGPTVLMLHGAGASTHTWRGMADLLKSHFRVVMLDLPGHGLTECYKTGDYSLPRTAKDVSALMVAYDVSPDAIIGHSAGAAIACKMAIDSQRPIPIFGINAALLPFDGLAGIAFPAFAKFAAQTSLVHALLTRRARDRSQLRRVIEGTGSRINEQMLDDYLRLMQRPDHVRSVLRMMAGWDLSSLLGDVADAKVLLHLWMSSSDRAVSAGATRAATNPYDTITVDIMSGLGHLAHENSPATFAASLLEHRWIKDILSGEKRW